MHVHAASSGDKTLRRPDRVCVIQTNCDTPLWRLSLPTAAHRRGALLDAGGDLPAAAAACMRGGQCSELRLPARASPSSHGHRPHATFANLLARMACCMASGSAPCAADFQRELSKRKSTWRHRRCRFQHSTSRKRFQMEPHALQITRQCHSMSPDTATANPQSAPLQITRQRHSMLRGTLAVTIWHMLLDVPAASLLGAARHANAEGCGCDSKRTRPQLLQDMTCSACMMLLFVILGPACPRHRPAPRCMQTACRRSRPVDAQS